MGRLRWLAAASRRGALVRAGFLQEYAITVDSDYLTITRIGPIRRWLRQRVQDLWKLFGMVHPPDEPL